MNGDYLWWRPQPCHECGEPFLGYTTQIRCQKCRPEYARIQTRAISRVRYAVSTGRLPRLTDGNVACVDCGRTAKHYDHRDYNKPLDVVPVCQDCNVKRGPAAPLKEKAA